VVNAQVVVGQSFAYVPVRREQAAGYRPARQAAAGAATAGAGAAATTRNGTKPLPKKGGGPKKSAAAAGNDVIVYDPNPDRLLAALGRLLGERREWPLLYLEGGLAVYGWRPVGASEGRFRAGGGSGTKGHPAASVGSHPAPAPRAASSTKAPSGARYRPSP